jgi:alkylation response protein AidB-like acyl-CoA dehydrogenase
MSTLADPGTADDTPADARLRAEARAWMEEHAARYGPVRRDRRQARDTQQHADDCKAWQRELDSGGWGAPTWPVEHGGRGLSGHQARIIAEEQARYQVPYGAQSIGISMVGPTLLVHGTDEQKARFLDPMRRGEHIWCQLFSEPDAGSDLASLRTKAERDGDEWVVDGQKVWTSGAHFSEWAMLLARTEPGSWRHAGITYFLLDMTTPGIDVRPIVQINRNQHFNEVHLDGVRIPAENVVGTVGDGWSVARTTLSAERVMIGSSSAGDHVEALIAAAQASGLSSDPAIRQALADVWMRATSLRLIGDRVAAATRKGQPVGAEASVMKLGLSRLMGRMGDLAPHVLGTDALLAGEGEHGYGPMQDLFLGQWSSRIGGGTEQIQRNVIGERALGLPREPRPERPSSSG